jgi:DNA-binding ferritin-like protein
VADLVLKTDELTQLAADLEAIREELADADANAAEAADATGHDELRDHVNDFADKWRIKRGEMLDDVTTLSEMITTIVENFGQVDKDLAAALEDAASGK